MRDLPRTYGNLQSSTLEQNKNYFISVVSKRTLGLIVALT